MAPISEIQPVTLARLQELHPDFDHRLAALPELAPTIGAINFASPLFTRLLLSDPLALGILENLEKRPSIVRDSPEMLARWKQLEMLRIAARDLTGVDQLEEVGANLAQLAQDVLQSALIIAGGGERLVVIAMGKLGGRELNYASDVDVMFVGEDGDVVARRVMEIARKCFRIDAALRPEGRDGPLVRSVESYVKYWESWAQTWEFQALLKSLVIAGPTAIGDSWTAAARRALWTKEFNADELRSLREMKARAEMLIERKGLSEREVKRGRGGIRDVEFSVQLLQLVHGRHDETLRSANTMQTLRALSEGGYVDPEDANRLESSYRFLRDVEHRLQLVEGEQTHTIPTDQLEIERLARTMHFRDADRSRASDAFRDELREHQSYVRNAHERLYFRPLLEAFAGGPIEHGGVLEERLSAFGFTDATRTRQAINELTRGLARSSRLMQQLMPVLLDWLSTSPDPDQGLLGLRTLIAGFRTPEQVVAVFRDTPQAARRLCQLLGTSRMFSQGLLRHPELFDQLSDENAFMPRKSMLDRVRSATAWQKEGPSRYDALRHFTRTEQLRIAAADVLEIIDPVQTGAWRSSLAEAILQTSLDDFGPKIPIAIIGLGRFGGDEMSYASDLDVVVVHGGINAADQAAAENVAQHLLSTIGNPSPSRHLYPLDYDLRPEGKKGFIARSLEGCADYYANWAQTWERQALIRARVVAGDPSVGQAFLDLIHPFVWERSLSTEELREIRRLKARMEHERIPKGQDPQFNLKLGRGSLSDVEWTVQLLQLQHHIEGTNTMRSLERLVQHSHLSKVEAEILQDAWQFCDRVRNRLFLVEGGLSSDTFPSGNRLRVLARSMDISSVELRERYLQVTRRARAVMERLFYGHNGS